MHGGPAPGRQSGGLAMTRSTLHASQIPGSRGGRDPARCLRRRQRRRIRRKTGTLKVGITDAPVDFAEAVVVQFSGVELKPTDGAGLLDATSRRRRRSTCLTLQGVTRALLLDGEIVPAGEYEWMRLKVEADPNVAGDSYVSSRRRRRVRAARPERRRDGPQADPRFHGRRRNDHRFHDRLRPAQVRRRAAGPDARP